MLAREIATVATMAGSAMFAHALGMQTAEAVEAAATPMYPNCGPSVRKAWEDLSCTERTQYLSAVRSLKDSGLYGDFAEMHFHNSKAAHGADVFLPWHRWFLWVFEKELQKVSKSCVTLPYWSWETDNVITPEVEMPWFSEHPHGEFSCNTFWDKRKPNKRLTTWCNDPKKNTGPDGLTALDACCGCGGGHRDNSTGTETCVSFQINATRQIYKPNPSIFHAGAFGSVFPNNEAGKRICVSDGVAQEKWLPRDPRSTEKKCLERTFVPRWAPDADEADIADMIVRIPNYKEFRKAIEGRPHARPHNWVGGTMGSHYSPDDPVFFLHHTNVDRIWALWQVVHDHDLVKNNNFTDIHYSGKNKIPRGWTEQVGGMDEPMPFSNPLRLDFTLPSDDDTVAIENRSVPTPRDMLKLYGGVTSVTYGADQMARVLSGLYELEPTWVEPAQEDNGTPRPCKRTFTFPPGESPSIVLHDHHDTIGTPPPSSTLLNEDPAPTTEEVSDIGSDKSDNNNDSKSGPNVVEQIHSGFSSFFGNLGNIRAETSTFLGNNLDNLKGKTLRAICKDFDDADDDQKRRRDDDADTRHHDSSRDTTTNLFRSPSLNKIYNHLTQDLHMSNKRTLIHTIHAAKCARSDDSETLAAPLDWIEMNNMEDQQEYFKCLVIH